MAFLTVDGSWETEVRPTAAEPNFLALEAFAEAALVVADDDLLARLKAALGDWKADADMAPLSFRLLISDTDPM